MIGNRKDHIVDFLSEERIEETVRSWLAVHFFRHPGPFNILSFLQNTLLHKLSKGPFTVDLYPSEAEPDPAFVTFEPLTLHVSQAVWDGAKLGMKDATKILLHECGHMILHNQFAQEVAYSDADVGGILSFPQERSGEWQAITFSEIGIRLVAEMQGLSHAELAATVKETLSPAARRVVGLDALELSGDACGECGNFTLVRNGTCLKCDTCGSTTGCS